MSLVASRGMCDDDGMIDAERCEATPPSPQSPVFLHPTTPSHAFTPGFALKYSFDNFRHTTLGTIIKSRSTKTNIFCPTSSQDFFPNQIEIQVFLRGTMQVNTVFFLVNKIFCRLRSRYSSYLFILELFSNFNHNSHLRGHEDNRKIP
jgi:hypothetical protein